MNTSLALSEDRLRETLDIERKERDLPPRRLEVRGQEDWCQCSDMSDTLVAVSYLRVPMTWLNSGLLIHPFLRIPGQLITLFLFYLSCGSSLFSSLPPHPDAGSRYSHLLDALVVQDGRAVSLLLSTRRCLSVCGR